MAGQQPVEDSDLRLMERIAEEDRSAIQALLDRYWARLVGYATSMLGSQDEAKDIVQETFIRVWDRREQWEPSGSVGSYLYRITRNLALNALRGASTRKGLEEAALSLSAHETQGDGALLDGIHIRKEVERAIAALPDRRREVFILSRFHGLSHAEIAETLETSPQTVANQMSTALAELRAALAHLTRDA